LFYAIALRLVNKKSSSFRHFYDLLCPKNLCHSVVYVRYCDLRNDMECVIFVLCMFGSVFAKLLMPVCGVRKFVNVLLFRICSSVKFVGVFIVAFYVQFVMSGSSPCKYDFRHVHCSAVQSWTFPPYLLLVIASVTCRYACVKRVR
jgi:hypothetical protein